MLNRPKTSVKANCFNESVIAEMSRLTAQCQAINLAEGFPDFPCPEELKDAAKQAIEGDINQYASTWGDRLFREALAKKMSASWGFQINPDTEITVTCGATEAMAMAMLACVDPGDEVIVFEPFYENSCPDAILAGATPRFVNLHAPQWNFDPDELSAAFNSKTRAIIVNTPHNPTGKVFNLEELTVIAELCQKWGVLAFADEIYEHIVYDDHQHIALASLPGMRELTVTISGLSKTYSVTGWRIGTVIACPEITAALRSVHDFLTGGAPAPLQRAGVTALNFPPFYYTDLVHAYTQKRQMMLTILDNAGIKYCKPQGAYYVFADISDFGYKTDLEFAHFLVKDIGVGVVPGSSFFSRAELGYHYVRFCFSKSPQTLKTAEARLSKLREMVRLSR